MKQLFRTLTVATGIALVASCSHSTIGRLVGNDRDEHGCIPSAGYTWSNALHDCVRVWEVGLRFDEGSSPAFLVFSTDSVYAEIFTTDKDPVLCRRVKGTAIWKATNGRESISIGNDVITMRTKDYIYTRPVTAR